MNQPQPICLPAKRGNPRIPVTEAEDRNLDFWGAKLAEGLLADPGKQWADKDRETLKAIAAEMTKRGLIVSDNIRAVVSGQGAPAGRATPPGGDQRQRSSGQSQRSQPAPQRAAPQTAIQKADDVTQMVIGSFTNGEAATKALMHAAANYHLVAPSPIVGSLPEGCEVMVSVVQIDPSGPEVYQITGNRERPSDDDTVGLDKTALAKIFGAMGGSWESSRRTDDGSHPHYCAWEVWAVYPGFDLQPQRFPGSVEIDTREDGEIRGVAAQEIRDKAAARARQYPNDRRGDGGESQLLELRKFLVRHAESKAMNRAIAARGVRRSYKRSELKKPFAVARLMFTGRSEDPEARREIRAAIADRFLGARSGLYGGGAPEAPRLPQAAPSGHGYAPSPAAYPAPPALHSPPPIGTVPRDEWDYETDGESTSAPENDAPEPQSDAGQPQAKQTQDQEGQQTLIGQGKY